MPLQQPVKHSSGLNMWNPHGIGMLQYKLISLLSRRQIAIAVPHFKDQHTILFKGLQMYGRHVCRIRSPCRTPDQRLFQLKQFNHNFLFHG